MIMHKPALGLFALLTLLLAACGSDPEEPTIAPLLVVEPSPAGLQQIGSLHADGTRGATLAGEAALILAPRWSPSGTKIAYAAIEQSDSSEYAIWLVELDASDRPGPPRELLRWQAEVEPIVHWLPDDRGLVWADMTDEAAAVRELELESGDDRWHYATRLSQLDVDAQGRLVGLRSETDQATTIAVFEADHALFVESEPGLGRMPAWSPQGDAIAFELTAAPGVGLLALDGTWTRLSEGSDHALAWAPDGRRISFVREDRLMVVDRTTGETSEVLDHAAAHAWSHDGTYLAMPAPNALAIVTTSSWWRVELAIDTFMPSLDWRPTVD